MKLQKLLIGAAALLVPFVAADSGAGEEPETFKYEVRPPSLPQT